MNGSQKHVDYTPLRPVERSDEDLSRLEGCLWFDIGTCGPRCLKTDTPEG